MISAVISNQREGLVGRLVSKSIDRWCTDGICETGEDKLEVGGATCGTSKGLSLEDVD